MPFGVKQKIAKQFYQSYGYYLFARDLRKNYQLAPLFVTGKKLIYRLREIKNRKQSSICHILGSGESLLHTKHLIQHESDLVFGLNRSALCVKQNDFYSLELFSHKNESRRSETEIVRSILPQVLSSGCEIVSFKGLCRRSIDGQLLKYEACKLDQGSKVCAVPELTIPYPEEVSRESCWKAANRLFAKRSFFAPQIHGSIYFCLALAFQIGCAKVVLHGQDFGGRYFFEAPHFLWPEFLTEDDRVYLSGLDSNVRGRMAHSRGEELLKACRDYLDKHGLKLLASSHETGSSKFLPVYEK